MEERVPESVAPRAPLRDWTGALTPVVDRFGHPAGVENLWWRGKVFLVLGGPSRLLLDQSLFRLPGVVTFAVNNVAGKMIAEGLVPDIWTYGDTTGKFHDAIWKCGRTLKFCPYPKLENPLCSKRDGRLWFNGLNPRGLPGVLGIARNTVFDPENFLWEPTVNWGNGKEGNKKNGKPRVLSTMFQALRLCHHLGFREVYLVGADFTMVAGEEYSFEESKHPGAATSNNESYAVMQVLLKELRPHLDAANFHVFNVNPESCLTAFDYLPFEATIARAHEGYPLEIDLSGWYHADFKQVQRMEPTNGRQ